MSSRTRNRKKATSYSHLSSPSQPIATSPASSAAIQISRPRRIRSAPSSIVVTPPANPVIASSTFSPVSPAIRRSQSIRCKKRSSALNSSANSFPTNDDAVGIRVEGGSTDAKHHHYASASAVDSPTHSSLSPVHIKRAHQQYKHKTSSRRKSKAKKLRATSIIRCGIIWGFCQL